MMPRQVVSLLASAAVSLMIPLVAHMVRSETRERCALDGTVLVPSYSVRLRTASGKEPAFCCIACAETWQRSSPDRILSATCTDEVTGAPLDCGLAVFARSGMITQATTGNRVHTFARRSDGLAHVKVAGGSLLEGPERPLQLRIAPHPAGF